MSRRSIGLQAIPTMRSASFSVFGLLGGSGWSERIELVDTGEVQDEAAGVQGASMAVRVTRSAGMLLLGIWLILTGLITFAALPIPNVLTAALALIARVLI
jgi:hypothetical protein